MRYTRDPQQNNTLNDAQDACTEDAYTKRYIARVFYYHTWHLVSKMKGN